jgi:hypothetical protein
VIARGIVLLVAAAVIAWFALGIRQSHDLNVANDRLSSAQTLSPAEAHQVASRLDRAGQLNPDTSVDLARSTLALHLGDAARARAIALSVTRAEPDNIDAWLTYASASGHDPQAFASALRHLTMIAPPVRR